MHDEDVAEARSVSLMIWGGFLVLQFNLAAIAIWAVVISQRPHTPVAEQWGFPFICVFGMIIIPLSFYFRQRIFTAYWHGHLVEPWDFIKGMTLPWAAVTATGALAILGCLVANTLMPNVIIAATMGVLTVILYPTGDVMDHPVGMIEDPSIFEHPS